MHSIRTLVLAACLALAPASVGAEEIKGQYADINGLHMYYEVHGQGAPILLIHGGLCTIDICFGALIDELAKKHQVIAYEFQGHGHTADIDRPLRTELLADDASKLLAYLNIPRADVLGYSIGAGTALDLARTHPKQVNKLITLSLSINRNGSYPELFSGMKEVTPDMFKGSPWLDAYNEVAPHPEQFGDVLKKISDMTANVQDVSIDELKKLKMPVLLIEGDSDLVKPEHGAELFRALGGGVFGDMQPMPASRLAILPGTSHVGLISRAGWIAEMVDEFLAAPPAK
ncbi:MAG: alpha/beta fold hydrolase [Hyphomicrobiales bacterium]